MTSNGFETRNKLKTAYGLDFPEQLFLFYDFMEATGNGWEFLEERCWELGPTDYYYLPRRQDDISTQFSLLHKSIDLPEQFRCLSGDSLTVFLLCDDPAQGFKGVSVLDTGVGLSTWTCGGLFDFLKETIEHEFSSGFESPDIAADPGEFEDDDPYEFDEDLLADITTSLAARASCPRMLMDVDAFVAFHGFDLDEGRGKCIPNRWEADFYENLGLVLEPSLYPPAKFDPKRFAGDESFLDAAVEEALSLCTDGKPGAALDLGRFLWFGEHARRETACRLLRSAYEKLGRDALVRIVDALQGDGILHASDAVTMTEEKDDGESRARWVPAPKLPFLDHLRQMLWSKERDFVGAAIGAFALVLKYLVVRRDTADEVTPEDGGGTGTLVLDGSVTAFSIGGKEEAASQGVYYLESEVKATLEELCTNFGVLPSAQVIASELQRRADAGFDKLKPVKELKRGVHLALAEFPAVIEDGTLREWFSSDGNLAAPEQNTEISAVAKTGKECKERDPRNWELENLRKSLDEDCDSFDDNCETVGRLGLGEAVPLLGEVLHCVELSAVELQDLVSKGKSPDRLLRAQSAATALAAIGDPASLPHIIRFAKQLPEVALIRPGVFLKALRKFAGQTSARQAFELLVDQDQPSLVGVAVSALVSLPSAETTLEALQRFLKRAAEEAFRWLSDLESSNYKVAEGWLRARGMNRNEEGTYFLPTIFETAMRLLEERGAAIVSMLQELIRSSEYYFQPSILRSLAETETEEATQALEAIVRETENWKAIEDLGRRRDPSVVPTLIAVIRQHPEYRAMVTCEVVGEALETIGREHARERLIELVKASPPNRHAALILGRWGDRRVSDILADMAEHGNSDLRARAVDALAIIGDRAALPVLRRVFSEFGPKHTYSFLGEKAREAIAVLDAKPPHKKGMENGSDGNDPQTEKEPIASGHGTSAAAQGTDIYLEFKEGESAKFWKASRVGETLELHWGKIGTAGQRKTLEFPSESKAGQEMEKRARSKLAKGYLEVTGKSPS